MISLEHVVCLYKSSNIGIFIRFNQKKGEWNNGNAEMPALQEDDRSQSRNE